MCKCAKAKLDLWLLLCIHTCATAKLESQRTAGSKTPRKGAAAAGRTKLLLYYCRTKETPGAPEDTRGNKDEHQRDRGAQRHHEDRRAQRGIGRDTKRTGGENGGIGAGRKATWIHQRPYVTAIPQRTLVSVQAQRLCNGHGRWSKATALFWCQNFYRELSQFHSQGTS